MTNKTEFDIGFDQGFNSGYDLGYEKGINECKAKKNSKNCKLVNQCLFSNELFENVILTIDKNRFIEMFNKFTSKISIAPISVSNIYERILSSLQHKNGFSILGTDIVLSDDRIHNDFKSAISCLRRADIILVPSLTESEEMFCINNFLINNDIFNDISLKSVIAQLFNSTLIRKLNQNSLFYVLDKNATHICNFLTRCGIDCRSGNDKKLSNSLCFIGNIENKFAKIDYLQVNKNIIIDITEIRNPLINKVQPIGFKR